MIFLLLFGILSGMYQLWFYAWSIKVADANSHVTIPWWPGVLSVLLIGAWFMLT